MMFTPVKVSSAVENTPFENISALHPSGRNNDVGEFSLTNIAVVETHL